MIREFTENDQDAVASLILDIQNNEFGLNLTLEDQPDLTDINGSYIDRDGGFWVAEEEQKIVGCLGLARASERYGVVKKFFVDKDFRGSSTGIATALFVELIEFAKRQNLKAIFLDTPSVATRSHTFYRRAGFVPIEKSKLPVPYEYPDRDSILFIRYLGA